MTSFNVLEVFICESDRGHTSGHLSSNFYRVHNLKAPDIAFAC